MAVNPNTDFTAGAILTAAQQNRFPRGVMGVAEKATTQSVSAEADLGLSVTFTAAANRIYKFTFTGTVFSTSNVVDSTLYLNDNSTNVKETIGGIVANTFIDRCAVFYVSGLTAGSKTYKLRAVTGGGLTAVWYGASTRASLAAQFIVEDIGPA
jgi:hypothetical protein